MEIIEIGAVMLNENLEKVDEFQTFIKPVKKPILTDFCKELTSITQEDVDNAPDFIEAMEAFYSWMNADKQTLWMSWGAYDRKQFDKDCQFHGISNNLPTHQNAKVLFSKALNIKKGYGMARALKRVGIKLDGTHHRGIDDARNIAKLIPYCLGREPIPNS